jgi:two-component system, NarL family, nitrate/nitrite response regulator NarL
MQEERKTLGRVSQSVAPRHGITTLNLPAADDAGVEPPNDYEGADSTLIRIVLADSETIYRVGIQKVFALEDDIRVIAHTDTLAGLHGAIQRFPTDMILLEGNLIAGTVDAIPELIRRAPQLKIIVQSAQNDESNTVELYCRGVRGIIPRSISADLLVKCVRKIAAGETWIDNQSINWVIEAYRSQATALTNLGTQPRLSNKELAIVTYIMEGKRNKEIADLLGTSEQVIKNYLRKVYDRLGVSDRLELALYCLRHQLHKKAAGTVAAIGAPVAVPLPINRGKL